MMLPRLERLVELAQTPEVARDPGALSRLRDDHRYMASVAMSLLPDLEAELADLPPGLPPGAGAPARIAFRMALIRRTNRLHRAVRAYVAGLDQRRQGYVGSGDGDLAGEEAPGSAATASGSASE